MQTEKTGYVSKLRSFTPNAKLYLAFCSFMGGVAPGGVVFGIWGVIYGLYLYYVGFYLDFIGLLFTIELIGHSLFVYPASILLDIIGRKRTFMLANAISIVAKGLLLSTLDPTFLQIFVFFSGVGAGAHAVVGAPFMVENSSPRERPHLFSMSQIVALFSYTVAASVGGLLPSFFSGFFSGPNPLGIGYRATLFLVLPLIALATIPIYMIRESPPPKRGLGAIMRNLQTFDTIGVLLLTMGLLAIGLGFVLTFFSLFFATKLGAATQLIGLIFSLGSLTGAAAAFFSPIMVEKVGRVKSYSLMILLSSASLLAMGLAPSILFAGAFFVIRNLTFGIGGPIRAMLTMEIVKPQERAQTEGLVHLFFDLPLAISAGLAGVMMDRGEFLVPFLYASTFSVIGAMIFFLYFRKSEALLKATAARQ